MIDRDEVKARIDLFRAAAASVIEASRDDGLTVAQYLELTEWMAALTELLWKHCNKTTTKESA